MKTLNPKFSITHGITHRFPPGKLWVMLRPWIEIGLIVGFLGSPCWLWVIQWWNTTQPQYLPVTAQLSVSGHEPLNLEVATTTEQHQKGLAHRSELSDRQGMMFVVNPPRQSSVWMNETKPVDILFIQNGRVVELIENAPTCQAIQGNCILYGTLTKVDAIIEIQSGLAKRLNIKEGSILTITNKR